MKTFESSHEADLGTAKRAVEQMIEGGEVRSNILVIVIARKFWGDMRSNIEVIAVARKYWGEGRSNIVVIVVAGKYLEREGVI